MYIDTSHITRGGKTYTRHLLRESYRAHGKVLHRTIANLSHCSAAEIEAMRLALRHKEALEYLGASQDAITFEFISINVRSSRGSSTWRTRSSTSVGYG